MGNKNKLAKAAVEAEMQFTMVGDMAISQEEIERSLVYQNLAGQKYPEELSRIHGLQDVMTARAIQGWARYAVYAIEARFAQARLEAYRLFRRARGDTEAVIEAAILAQQQQGQLPYLPTAPVAAPPQPGITYPIAAVALPGGGGIDMAALRCVSLDNDGKAYVSMPQTWSLGSPPATADPVGIATLVNRGQVVVAYPGMLVSGYSGLKPGGRYFVGWDGTPTIYDDVLKSAHGNTIWVREIGRALTTAILQVVEATPFTVVPAL